MVERELDDFEEMGLLEPTIHQGESETNVGSELRGQFKQE